MDQLLFGVNPFTETSALTAFFMRSISIRSVPTNIFIFYFLSVLGSAGFISSSISSSGVNITVVSPRFLWLNVM